MASDTEHAIIDLLVAEGFNRGNLDVVDEHVSPDFTSEMLPPGTPPGPEGLKGAIQMWRTGFPDLHFTVTDQIAEPGKVVNRWTMRGTHQGPFLGIGATGREVSATGISIWYLRDNKVVDTWVNFDALGLMQQLQSD